MSGPIDSLPVEVTRVLDEVGAGGRHTMSALLPIVYADLRQLAERMFHQERPGHTLQPTALLHEAFLRLMEGEHARFASREHFFRAAAVIMRHILVNHARDLGRRKRGGNLERRPLDEWLEVYEERAIDLDGLDTALDRLALWDKRQAQIIELRFFAGLSFEEVASVLGLSARTVEREWALARTWLKRELDAC
ncbi:MAG: ECF-type sigma factor [Phycisphaerae bacterium]